MHQVNLYCVPLYWGTKCVAHTESQENQNSISIGTLKNLAKILYLQVFFFAYSDITEGMLIEESDQGFFPGEDGLITETEARNLVLAAGYETGVHPGYDPRLEIF